MVVVVMVGAERARPCGCGRSASIELLGSKDSFAGRQTDGGTAHLQGWKDGLAAVGGARGGSGARGCADGNAEDVAGDCEAMVVGSMGEGNV